MVINISDPDNLYGSVAAVSDIQADTSGKDFAYGIEAEFLLLDRQSLRPLFYDDLNFEHLLDLTDVIAVQDISHRGYDVKPLHRLASPYLIEGYYLTDKNMKAHTLLAKGVELRTPIADSIEDSVSSLEILHRRLQVGLRAGGYDTAIISHHPVACKFDAPPNYERHDYWQWALTAMTTMGPDLNISMPAKFTDNLDLADLNDKINYYMPSLVALSLASPLLEGQLWQVRGKIGKSIRTYRRSLWAPLYYIHNKNGRRFEFKGFEMSQYLDDYKAFFMMCLALLLDEELTGRASDQTRTYDMGQIAVHGLELSFVQERAAICLESAAQIALQLGLDPAVLDEFWQRLQTRRTPADDIIDDFSANSSIPQLMGNLTNFYKNKKERDLTRATVLPLHKTVLENSVTTPVSELCLR